MAKGKKHIDFKDIPKKDIYQVPEGYFDSLPDKIYQRISESEERKTVPKGGEVNWKMISYAAAACITLLAVAFIIFQNGAASTSPEDLLAEVSSADLLAYLEYSEVDAYEIIESADPALWDQTLVDPVEALQPDFNEEDIDLLYELYGVSPDENLQTF